MLRKYDLCHLKRPDHYKICTLKTPIIKLPLILYKPWSDNWKSKWFIFRLWKKRFHADEFNLKSFSQKNMTSFQKNLFSVLGFKFLMAKTLYLPYRDHKPMELITNVVILDYIFLTTLKPVFRIEILILWKWAISVAKQSQPLKMKK